MVALIAIGLYKSSRKKEIRESVMNDVLSTQNYNPKDTFLNTNSLPVVDTTHAQTKNNSDTVAVAAAVTTDITNETSNKSISETQENEAVNENLPSKEETEKWILSKLNEFSEPSSNNYYTETKPIFNFDEHYLIISSSFIDVNKNLEKKERINIEKIPVYDINEISNSNSYSLSFKTNKKTIIKILDNGIRIVKSVNDYEGFSFKCDAETDLIDRISKAFFHLKKFYKMPKNKETF